MASQPLIYVDGVQLPQPTKYSVPLSDIDSSDTARNELAVLIRNRIRQGVFKITVSWTLQGPQLAAILSAVKPDKVTVKFLDPNTYTYKEAQMYVGDRTCEMKSYVDGAAFEDIWWNLELSLVEY